MAEAAIASSASSISEGRPFYTRVTVAGLLLFTAGIALFMLLAIVQGITEGLAFFAIFPILGLVTTGLVLRFGRWALIVAAVFGLINLVLHSPFIVYPLTKPNSFFDFVLTLVVLVGIILAIAGAVTAFVQHRRGTARTEATVSERRVMWTLAMALAAVAIVSGILTLTGRTTIASGAKAGATAMKMESLKFKPEQLEIQAGGGFKLAIKNSDLTIHTFTIKELGVDETIQPGSEALVELPSMSAGTYEYICDVPGHESMTGTLVVQ